MTRSEEALLLAIADRLDELLQQARYDAGTAGGFDSNGEGLGGWVNHPFTQRFAQVIVDMKDAVAAVRLTDEAA